MENKFFEKPILNSPYEYPRAHWELDSSGQPTQQIIASRRSAEFITPIPKPKKRKGASEQVALVFDEGKNLSTQEQQYDHTATINALRRPKSKKFTRGFLLVAPGLPICEQLRVRLPHDSYACYANNRRQGRVLPTRWNKQMISNCSSDRSEAYP